MRTEPLPAIPTVPSRRLRGLLIWAIATAVAIGVSYARAAHALPTCTAEAGRLNAELIKQALPSLTPQGVAYLAETLNTLTVYGRLPNRYDPEGTVDWPDGANRPAMLIKRSVGGGPWGQTGWLQADVDDGLGKRGPLRLIYARDGVPQFLTTTAPGAPRVPAQRCTDPS